MYSFSIVSLGTFQNVLASSKFYHFFLKAGINLKAVVWLSIMLLMQISRLRFKQSRISMLNSNIYVLGRFVNFGVIYRYIWR